MGQILLTTFQAHIRKQFLNKVAVHYEICAHCKIT